MSATAKKKEFTCEHKPRQAPLFYRDGNVAKAGRLGYIDQGYGRGNVTMVVVVQSLLSGSHGKVLSRKAKRSVQYHLHNLYSYRLEQTWLLIKL